MTLIEMLVVLLIIGLAYAFAMPNFRNPTKSVGLRTMALDMKSRLAVARAVAIARNRPVAVIIDLPRRRYASEADGRWIPFPADMSVSVTTARDIGGDARIMRLAFFPDGSSSGGHVLLRRDNRSYDVAIDWLTGQASVKTAP